MLFFSAHNVPDKPKIAVVHLPESILKSIGVVTRGARGARAPIWAGTGHGIVGFVQDR